MSIRKFEFEVFENRIIPNTEQAVGMQSEHNATTLHFTLDSSLYQKLINNLGVDEKIVYRFDCCDSMGNTVPYEPFELKSECVDFSIGENLARMGGKARVYLVVTRYSKVTGTSIEFKSMPAKLRFENIPKRGKSNGDSLESISKLAQSAKDAAERADRAADKTENAKLGLEGESIFIFDGGDAETILDIDLVVDGEFNENSDNPATSKAIAETLKSVILAAHPIGSLYWSSDPTNPGVIFGGEWKQIKDRFVLAAGDSYSVGDTDSGEAEVTLDELQMPSHSHLIHGWATYGIGNGQPNDRGEAYVLTKSAGSYNGDVDNWGEDTFYRGGNQPHNNMPPYTVRYCWERIS